MLIKYWKGMLRSNTFASEGWIKEWGEEIKKAEAEKCTLIVFKIPNDPFGTDLHVIEQIEYTLQNDFY